MKKVIILLYFVFETPDFSSSNHSSFRLPFFPSCQFHPFYCSGQKLGVSSAAALPPTPRVQSLLPCGVRTAPVLSSPPGPSPGPSQDLFIGASAPALAHLQSVLSIAAERLLYNMGQMMPLLCSSPPLPSPKPESSQQTAVRVWSSSPAPCWALLAPATMARTCCTIPHLRASRFAFSCLECSSPGATSSLPQVWAHGTSSPRPWSPLESSNSLSFLASFSPNVYFHSTYCMRYCLSPHPRWWGLWGKVLFPLFVYLKQYVANSICPVNVHLQLTQQFHSSS